MLRRVLIFLLLLLAPRVAQAQNIRPELAVEGPVAPGGEVDLAIVMRPSPGWHGYWQNPGDAGLPMSAEWQLPPGASVGLLRYPVPQRLEVAGLMNYVYEGPYAVLVRLRVPATATQPFPVTAKLRWLACTDKICVPEEGTVSAKVAISSSGGSDPQFDTWRSKLPRALATPAHFEIRNGKLRVAIPLPRSVEVSEPYLYPATDNAVDYEAPQAFSRTGDTVVAELSAKGAAPEQFAGVLALADDSGFAFEAVPGAVPSGGTPIGEHGWQAIVWAVMGAIAGGILLNLMPCVFPILALKALHLSRAGGEEREARSDALAYTAGAVVGTGFLGVALLLLKAAGAEAGWAFQLQDPRTVLLLLLLAVAITANLLGLFELPVLGGRARPAGGFATGALAAFVATPCAGPFLGAALGTALLLPAVGAVAVFAALGFGLALPFVLVAFVPGLRRLLPRPGEWMKRLQRFLAIPMAATAAACLWLLYRQSGGPAFLAGTTAAAIILMVLAGWGFAQRKGRAAGAVAAALVLVVGGGALAKVPVVGAGPAKAIANADAWSIDRVERLRETGKPVFVYFTADWCLTCKANEAAAIDREAVQAAFRQNGVTVLAGDWTNGDPVITRFLESRGRAGVPLYLWYAPGKAEPEEMPQILTPAMLISRARSVRALQP